MGFSTELLRQWTNRSQRMIIPAPQVQQKRLTCETSSDVGSVLVRIQNLSADALPNSQPSRCQTRSRFVVAHQTMARDHFEFLGSPGCSTYQNSRPLLASLQVDLCGLFLNATFCASPKEARPRPLCLCAYG